MPGLRTEEECKLAHLTTTHRVEITTTELTEFSPSSSHDPSGELQGHTHKSTDESSSTAASVYTPSPATPERLVPRIEVEIKLFVAKVPKTYTDAHLREVFSVYGVVKDVIIIRDRETMAHRCCAFIRMASITAADLAIRQLNNIRVLDPKLGPIQIKYAFGEPERLGLLTTNCQPGVDQAKLFVGSIPKIATENEILKVFSPFGSIDEVFVMRDAFKVSNGCAFVRFSLKEEAFNAIANLNKAFVMDGGTRAIEVRFAEHKGFEKHQQQHQLSPRYQSYKQTVYGGSTAATSLTVFSTRNRTTAGFPGPVKAFPVPSFNLPVEPIPQQQPNSVPRGVGAQTHGPPGANVFIFHIPNDWTEQNLMTKFSAFGQIVSARISTDKGTGRCLGFGFVSYSRIEAAAHAVMALNGSSVCGKRLKVTIKRGEEQYNIQCLQAESMSRRYRERGFLQRIPLEAFPLMRIPNQAIPDAYRSEQIYQTMPPLASNHNNMSHIDSRFSYNNNPSHPLLPVLPHSHLLLPQQHQLSHSETRRHPTYPTMMLPHLPQHSQSSGHVNAFSCYYPDVPINLTRHCDFSVT